MGLPTPAAVAESSSASDGLLNLVLRPGAGGSLGSLAGLIASAGATSRATGIPGLYAVRGSAAALGSLAAELAASPAVAYAAPPMVVRAADAPDNPSYLDYTQWYLNGAWGINAPGAWSVTTGSSQVIVANADTGIAYNYANLVDNLWLNQAEIPASVRPNLTDTNGDGLITFVDLNQSVNQGTGKIIDVNNDGQIDGADVIAQASSGGWASGSTQDGDTTHPDDMIGWNFIASGDGNNSPLDSNGHGTFTAGEIAAVGNNGTGVSGVNWSVQLMPVQMLNSGGSGTDAQAVAAIQYAVDHGAKVINASWGAGGVDPAIAAAIQYADQHGVIIVAAAGNNGTNNDDVSTWFSPASYSVDYPNLISVAATDINGRLPSWSNYGVHSVQLAAPGSGLYGLSRNGYTSDSGTSMAAPLVTGTIALVQAAHPTWSMTQVIDAVLDTTTPDPYLAGKVATGGIVNAAAAVANTNGPYVVSSSPGGAISGSAGLSTIAVTFNEEINPATFTAAQATLTGPGGAVGVVSVAPVVGSNDHTFAIAFPTQSAAGAYTLTVGPNVQDWYGNDMNQNRNGVNGEPADAFVATINQASGGSADVLLVSGIPSTVTAGASNSFTVTALAPGGGTDTGFLGTIKFKASDPQVSGLPASYTFTSSDQGVHSFSVTFNTAGFRSITATATSSAAITGSESNILVQPAAAKMLLLDTSSSPTAGVPVAVTVTAIDAYGNVATSYTGALGFSSTDTAAQFPVVYNGSTPAGLVPATYTFAPEQQGTGTFDVTFETTGTQTLTVKDKGNSTLKVTSRSLSVQAGSGTSGNPNATATTFANPIGSSASGQAVTLTTTVNATGNGIADPTDGSVSFYQGSTLLGTVDLSGSNQASYTTDALAVGTYAFFASYNGDADTYQPSASPVMTQVVNHDATNLVLSSSAATTSTGQSVTFTATATVVGPSGSTPPTPTGTVVFYDGTTALGSASLDSSNQATWTTSTLIPGTHAIVAVYNGDSLTQVNQSPTITQTVTPASESVVYVNSAWTGVPNGTQVAVGGNTYTIGTNAFATIQAGVDGVAAAGTINVLAGTYFEQVAIGQSLTLAGAGASSTTLSPPASAGGAQVAIVGGTSVSVTISGLTLAGAAPLIGIANGDGATLTVNGVAVSGDNVGIAVEAGSTATVTGSSITGNSVGILDANGGTVAVTQSAITGNGIGILVGNGGGDTSTLTAQQDNFAGDGIGLQDVQDPTIFSLPPDVATDNWWGSITGPTSASNPGGAGVPVVGNVNVTPWIGVYTNGTPAGQPGFTPNVTVSYAVPTQLVFTTEPSASAIEGQVLATQPVVEAEDASGNLGINFNGQVDLALDATSGSGTLGGTSAVAASGGIASFSGLSISEPGTYTLTASASTTPWTSLTAAASSPATSVTDGALTDTTHAQTYNVTLGNSLGSNPVVLTTFTDANPMATASDYTVSVNWGGSVTATSDSVQFVSSSANSSTWEVIGNATYSAAGTYTVSVTVTDVDLGTNTFTDTLTTVNVSGSTATFIKKDPTTQGNWIGTYGGQGYDIEGGVPSLPSYAAVSFIGASTWTWASSTTDVRGLQNPGGSGRTATTWYSATSFTIDVNLSDGQVHDLAIYAVDWTQAGRSEQVQVVDAASGAVLDTESLSSFGGGAYLQWAVSGHVQLRVTNQAAGLNAVVSGLFLDQPAVPATATFIKKDPTTQGNWIGTYGGQGYDIEGGVPNLPSYAAVSFIGASTWTWASSTTDVRGLQNPGGSGRTATTWYSTTSFTIDVNLSDGQVHDLTIYAVDWTQAGRSEQVQVVDAASGAVLDTESLSSFGGGAYLQWAVSGHVQLRVTNQAAGFNAVVSGLFLDQPAVPATATFIKKDPTTQGNWIGTYGGQGNDIEGGVPSLPSYAAVSFIGASTWTWASSTTDVRGLQNPGGSGRTATTWYSATSFTIDVNLSDGQVHDLAIYAVDWTQAGRSEQVQVVDAASGAVLDTESLSSFGGGAYLQWAVSGHVQLRVTNQAAGFNAVVSGLFLDQPSGAPATAAAAAATMPRATAGSSGGSATVADPGPSSSAIAARDFGRPAPAIDLVASLSSWAMGALDFGGDSPAGPAAGGSPPALGGVVRIRWRK